MSARKGYRPLGLMAALAVLAGCATNRILKCEGHLVAINPAPPKPVLAAPAPVQKSPSPQNTGHKP